MIKKLTKANLKRELNTMINRLLNKNKQYRKFEKKYCSPIIPLEAVEYAMARNRLKELTANVPLTRKEAAEFYRLDAWVKKQDKKNPVSCGHANEVPVTCPCSEYCYCRTHTCKGSIYIKNMTLVIAAAALTNAAPGTNEFGFWWWKVLELMKELRDAGEQGKSKRS